jgi:flagellar protein FliT
MSSQSEVMHSYEQLATLSERMLGLARSKQWGELPALEEQHSRMVRRLGSLEIQETLTEEQSARKYQLLGRIIANQKEIISCVMPQLAMLGDTLRRMERQDNLRKAYGQTDNAQR